MKILVMAIAIVLSSWTPVVFADEASQRLIIDDLLNTMKADQMIAPLFTQMRSMMEQQFNQMGASEDMKPILKSYTDKLFVLMEETLSWKILKEDIINIYMQSFSEDELKGMLKFYKSPVGQSVISKMPLVLQQSMSIMQKRMPEMQQKIKKITEELAQEIKAEMEKRRKNQNKDTNERSGT